MKKILRIYSKMTITTSKKLLRLLDQLSGNFVLLDYYLETKDERLLWTKEEDLILENGGL